MRNVDPKEAFAPLGRKVEPPVPPQPEPAWRAMPGQRGYETNGDAVRRTPGEYAT